MKAVLSVSEVAFTDCLVQLKKRMGDEDMQNLCDESLNPFALLNVETAGKECIFLPHALPRNLGQTSSYDLAYYVFWAWGLSQKLAEFIFDIVSEEISKN